MNNLIAIFGLFGVLFVFLLWAFPICMSIYGLVLAFRASLILGVLVFVIQPAPFILGVLGLFGHPQVAKMIATWIGL